MEPLTINILITLTAFIAMEGVAWFTHKYIMHGILWNIHKDHHKKESKGFFEHNDLFFLIFAIPGMAALYYGIEGGYNYLFWVGLGITMYGMAYFLVHDVFIHQRFKILRNTDNTYFKAIRHGHKMHHKNTSKKDGESFGMLWVSMKFFRKVRNK